MTSLLCSFEGCGRDHFARTLCHTHYQQMRRGVELTPIRPRRRQRATTERDEHGRKLCLRCDLWHPEDEFVRDSSHSDGLTTYCKACRSARMRAWRYGLSADDLAQMVHDQGGTCALCPASLADGYCIDHDHACCASIKSCGKCVRGLLCQECNKLAGKLEGDPDRTWRMLAYLGMTN